VLRDPQPPEEHEALTVPAVAARLVPTVRNLQPHGPYFLGGHCYGGIVAFELACQLAASGDQVALLALFDCPTPGYPKVIRRWKQYCRRAITLPFDRPFTSGDLFAHLRFLLRLAARKRETARLAKGSGTAAAQPVDGPSRPGLAGETAARIYRPRPFPGKVTVFLAAGERHDAEILEDSRLGWRDFARGGFEVYRVPGGHGSMLSEQHASELACHLATVLSS
jgi:thioesterase domain-containing protein